MSFLLQDEGGTTGRRARVGRSSRQDLHSHLWRQSDTQSPEPSTSSTVLGSTFSNKTDTVTKHVATFRGQAPVLPESLCHPMPSKPLPTEPIRRVDLGPLGSFGHKTGFLGSQECLIRKVPQAIVAPFRRAPPASSSSATPVIPIHRASIPTTAAVSVSPSPSSSVVTQASLESSGPPPGARTGHGQLPPDGHQEPVQRKENWAGSSKEASSVRDPGAGDSSVSAHTGPSSLVTPPQDKMQSKIKKCQVAVERLRQNSVAKPHAVTVMEPEDALEADIDLSSDCVTTNSNLTEPSGAVLNIEVTAENSAGLNIVSGDRSSKENKCSNNKLESAIKKKEGNDNDSSELLTKVSGGNLNEGKITSLNKTEPEQNIIKSRKRRRKTNKTGFPTKVKKKKVLTSSTKTENETVVASDANKNINIHPDIIKPAPALHPGCDGSGKFDKRDTFKISAANIETDPSRQSTSGRPLRVCRVQEDTAEEEKVETETNKRSSSEVRVKREKRLRSTDDGKERKKIRRFSSKRSKQSSSKGTPISCEPSTANSEVESVDFRSYFDAMEMDVGDFLTTLPSSEDSLLSPSLSESSEQQLCDKQRKSKPDIELKKNFMKAGLFSQDYKTEKLRKKLSDGENNLVKTKGTMYNPTEHPFSLLPPPYYCGRQLRQKKEDFALPFDLWSLHSSDSLPNRDILAGQNYKRIKTNIFYDVKQSGDYETPACHCKPPTEPGKPVCGKSCLNRMTFTECDPDSCPLGDRCSNMAIQKQKSSVTVQRFMTRDKGWGIKTRTSVVKGTFIMEYLGEVVTDKEFKRRMQTDYKHDSHHYCLHVGEGLVIDGYRMGGECRFVNHSCAPNCEMQKWSVNGVWRMALFSKVPIDINEELTYDYNFSWFDTREGQTCHCGAAECRGIIGGKGKKTSKSPKSSKSSNSNEELKSKKNSDDSETLKERNQNSKSQFTMEHLNHSSLNQFVPIKSMSTNQKDFCRKHSVLLLRNLDKIKRMRDLFFYGEGNVTDRSYTKPTSKRDSGKGVNIEQYEVAPVSSEPNLVKLENEENFKDNQSFPPAVRSVQTRLLTFSSENSSPSKVTQISNIFQNIMDKLGSLRDEQGETLICNFDKAPTKEEFPSYHIKITEHMDFSIIKTRLNAGSYHSVTQIDQDILLLFQNNIRFYGLSHQVGKYANELRSLYKGVSQEHRVTLAEIVGDRDVQCLTGPEVIRKEEEDVINCGCGQFRDEGVMIQCDKCECWQHTDCVLPDLKEDEEPPDNWICVKCDPEKKDMTPVDIALVPQPEFAGPGEIYNVFMMREDGMQLKLGMTVYVLRAPKVEDNINEAKRDGEDNITVGHGGIPHKSISPIKGPSKEAESLHAGNYPTYKSVDADLVSTQDMDIFRVERLWVNEAGKKFAFGYHYLRPHETFHEPSRKFYDNEVFRVPLYEVLPLDTIWKQCWVMDPFTFCR